MLYLQEIKKYKNHKKKKGLTQLHAKKASWKAFCNRTDQRKKMIKMWVEEQKIEFSLVGVKRNYSPVQ